MNKKRSSLTAVLTLVLSLLAIFASLEGIFNSEIYGKLLESGAISETLVLGSVAQDIISLVLGIVLAALSAMYIIKGGYRTFIAILGLTANFFYNYGLYTIQGQYSSLYLVYLAIFSMAIYCLIFGFISFKPDDVKDYRLPGALRVSIIALIILIVAILGPAWLGGMSASIAANIHGDTYGVYVLDLGIVFPALGITAFQLIRRRPLASTLGGFALLKIFGVCLTWGFAEWFVPLSRGMAPNAFMAAISTFLTLTSLVLIFFYMFKLKKGE